MTLGWMINIMKRGISGLWTGNPSFPFFSQSGRGFFCHRALAGLCCVFDFLKAAAWLAVIGVFLAAAFPSFALVQGDKIVNNAELNYAHSVAPATASVVVTGVVRTPSTIEALTYAPVFPAAQTLQVAPSAYRAGSPAGDYHDLPAPVMVGSTTPIDLSQPVPLVLAAQIHQGDPIFIRLTDLDQNLDSALIETVFITITNPANGDVEIIRLTETGPNTGVFAGYLPTSNGPMSSYNGSLSVKEEDRILFNYVDITDGTDTSATAVMVDPYALIFDSSTGLPIAGATVTLINAATGLPATVYGDDGVSIVSSSVVTDATGRFRFPFVVPGSYLLQVTPPAGYAHPSTVPTPVIQSLPGGPFAIVEGSRGETFVVNPGPALRIDIPLDPAASSLWLQKTSNKDFVGHGDFISYRLTLSNSSKVGAAAVRVTDTMPMGFRYRGGSTKINGVSTGDPEISSSGRQLTFTVGTLVAGATVTIDYVVEVAAGARLGDATNIAVAAAQKGTTSNQAKATVKVRDDFLRTKSVLVGRVSTGPCSEKTGEGPDGLEGVRVYLEDGTFVVTDKNGMFHFEGVSPGLHVVQLDVDSLPDGYEPFACTQNSRFAGRAFSQFVETQGGALWRADFHVHKKDLPPPECYRIVRGEITLELANTLEGETIKYQVKTRGAKLPASSAKLNVILPPDVIYKKSSAKMDGKAIADPRQEGTTLIFDLGDLSVGWIHQIDFQASLAPQSPKGILAAQAYLSAGGTGQAEVLTPPAETSLELNKFLEVTRMPDVVLRPHFSIRSADLNPEDQVKLDELAASLAGLRIDKIEVIGHTDSMRIAPQNRIYFADNNVLSFARAKTVARYLMDKLKLTPDKIFIDGKGSSRPIADNRTAAGRAQNRRVEVLVTSSRVVDREELKVLVERSGEKRVETTGVSTEDLQPPEIEKKTEREDVSGVTIRENEGILSPADNDILADGVNSIRICLGEGLTPKLFVDKKEIPVDRIGFIMKDDKAKKTLYSYIGVDFGKAGEHLIELQGVDPFGIIRFQQNAKIRLSGEIKFIKFKSAEGNVADGKTPVKIVLEMYDASGTRIPAAAELEIRDGNLAPLQQPDLFAAAQAPGSYPRVRINREGEVLFAPVNQSGPYRVVLGYRQMTVEAETYVQPKLRDWILVGLAEGTMGYNTVSGNMESLSAADVDDAFYKDGRVAFFAKGKIQGKWLLTVAYDSAKTEEKMTGTELFQTINPESYFTLYGDATQQQYDAASSKKLYVKLERDQFYALFGDYDTGLTVTELSRYSRRMTGVKTELRTKNFELNAFASETDQVYVRDEIPGDGTSGIYRLSHANLIPNGETVTLEIRDRFRSEVVLSRRVMNRFTDYSIDYDAGTLFFKEPIYSRDENLNPIIIVAEYEVESSGGKDYTYGGRAGVKLLENKVKAGASYIHEGQNDRYSNLYGVDATVNLDQSTKVRGEFATSDYSAGTDSRSGNAYLAEISRSSARYEAKAYIREQAEGFGLGQQPGSEAGTRKLGVEGAYRFNEKMTGSANIYRQYNLLTDATRDLAEGKFGYTEKQYGASVGFLHARDHLGNGDDKESNQITLGGKVLTLYDRLTLSLNHAQSIGSNDNSDFPTRTVLGAEFAATKKLTLLAAQEFTWGSGADTQNTRVGMRYSPWKGADISSSVERQFNENDERVFANVGLKQTWQVTNEWKVDAGIDRSQTVTKNEHYVFNTNVPPASGGHEDFTAFTGGATYQTKKLTWDNRVEFRFAETEDKWGLLMGIVKEVDRSWAWSGRIQFFQKSVIAGIDSARLNLRHGIVYRPPETTWIAMNRLDLIVDRESGGAALDTDSWRFIDNFVANYHPFKELEISLHYGVKYVREDIERDAYGSFTHLLGIEGRYDLDKYWDVGVQGSVLHSWNAGQFDYSGGLSVGYNMAQNAWMSLGYNVVGFEDKDFSDISYTAQGPFVRLRLKFDQESVREAAAWLNGN